MTNRRQFIQSSLAVSATSWFAASALSAPVGAAEAPALRLDRFVVDTRFAEAVETALHAAHQGIRIAETSGDVTNLWYDDLDLRWKKAPMALAGMTTRSALFVLETLAADHRMRVVYRGEHGVPQGGRVVHVLAGPAALLARATPAPDASSWGPLLGGAMTRCPAGRPAAAQLEWTTPAHASTREEPLFSWIIAPRTSVALRV
jgi:hypothetical protein